MTAAPRWRVLGLPRNPFGELTPDEWAAAAVVDLDPLLAWLAQDGRCLQLVGPPGRGKTTHLHALRRAIPGSVWRRAGQDPPGPGAVVLLDEADAVGPFGRWSHLRRARRCAIATHGDHTRELRWLGWDVRTVAVAARPHDVARIAAARLAIAGGAPLPDLHPHLAGDDLRTLTNRLYDVFQERVTPGAAAPKGLSADSPPERHGG